MRAKSVLVSNDQLVTVRDAMRGLNRLLTDLDTEKVSRFILTRRNQMVAAVIPLSALDADTSVRAVALTDDDMEAIRAGRSFHHHVENGDVVVIYDPDEGGRDE